MTDIAKWMWEQILLLFAHVEITAGAAGMVLGVAATDFVARMLPPSMDADYAYRLTRLIVFGAVTIAAFALDPTPIGLVIAVTAGCASPAIQALMMRAVYARWPAMKPQSLVSCVTDRPAPPGIGKSNSQEESP